VAAQLVAETGFNPDHSIPERQKLMSFLIRDNDWREEQYDHEMMYGDPRVCDRHPNQKTSSPDGMFDSPCPQCEYEMDRREVEDRNAEYEINATEFGEDPTEDDRDDGYSDGEEYEDHDADGSVSFSR
jgi:hypothetical protein